VLPKSLNAPEPKPPSKSHELLRPWLELANLLSPPPLSNELERLQNVLASILRVDQWEAECHDLPAAEIVRRFERSPLAHEAAIVASLDLQELHTDEEQARSFRGLIAEIASTLRALVAAPSPKVLQQVGEMLIKRLYVNPATSRSEIWVRNGLVATSLVDPYKDFLTALAGVVGCASVVFALASSLLCERIRRHVPSYATALAVYATGVQIRLSTNIDANCEQAGS
jgi:hypothetical protein